MGAQGNEATIEDNPAYCDLPAPSDLKTGRGSLDQGHGGKIPTWRTVMHIEACGCGGDVLWRARRTFIMGVSQIPEAL